MRLKINNFIGMFALLLAGLMGPWMGNALAATEQTANQRIQNADNTSRPDIVAAAYRTETFSDYISLRSEAAVTTDKFTVSSVSEVDVWTMLVAIFGLISLRLWHGGKKRFPAIN